MSFRSIADESICDPDHSGDATLVALRLENNYIDPKKVSPSAFSCVRSSSSVVLKPQKTKWPEFNINKRTLAVQTITNKDIFSPPLASFDAVCFWKNNGKKAHMSDIQVEHGKKESVKAVTVDVISILGTNCSVISLDWILTSCIKVRLSSCIGYCTVLNLLCSFVARGWQSTLGVQNPSVCFGKMLNSPKWK